MAISSWNKLGIKQVSTKKKFFGKYLYKVSVLAPACRIIKDGDSTDVAKDLKIRQERIKIDGYWANLQRQKIHNADVTQLEYLQLVKHTNENLTFRFEEPYVSIYAATEEELLDFVQGLPSANAVKSVHRPATEEEAEILNRGEIISRNTDYKYKVILKEHRVTNRDTLRQVYDYLDSLGKDVKILSSCRYNLRNDAYWFNQCYFYVQDPGVCTFINLMAPNLIKEILKVAQLE